MSVHIGAKQGEIAERILLPGDPLRAKFVAENFLENARCYNEVRGMYGFTGTYKGIKVSVQGTGMGQPSMNFSGNMVCKRLSGLVPPAPCKKISRFARSLSE